MYALRRSRHMAAHNCHIEVVKKLMVYITGMRKKALLNTKVPQPWIERQPPAAIERQPSAAIERQPPAAIA